MRLIKAAAFAIAACVPSGALSQSYPSGTVREIVPFPPGSDVDITTRLVIPKLSE